MAKTRLNTEEAFKSIMGKTSDNLNQNTTEANVGEAVISPEVGESRAQEMSQKKQSKEKLVQTAFYITKKQHRALKIKAALGENPEDKDQSAIVRAALDAYLTDTLKTL